MDVGMYKDPNSAVCGDGLEEVVERHLIEGNMHVFRIIMYITAP